MRLQNPSSSYVPSVHTDLNIRTLINTAHTHAHKSTNKHLHTAREEHKGRQEIETERQGERGRREQEGEGAIIQK